MGGSKRRFSCFAVIVCDSVGCGDAPDAASFGDQGANTLAHVIESQRPQLKNLARLGLDRIPGVPPLDGRTSRAAAAWGRMVPQAPAKDTMLGHWELMGVIAEHGFALYPDGFPEEILAPFRARIGREVLGNRSASGTEIIKELGAEHVRTGRPIVYTSGDSVFQIAAHEEVIAVEDLYAMCRIARQQLPWVGRIIARPFIGDGPDDFKRTVRRKDLPLPPPALTAIDHLQAAGIGTYAIGKINDIFVGRGITQYEKTADNAAGIEATRVALETRPQPFVFTNLVDFDSEFGHRNDPAGYAGALEQFDRAVPGLVAALPDDGCLVITADHGNDPTTPGTDHSRECVPLLVAGAQVGCHDLGTRATLADVAATLLENFGVQAPIAGRSFLSEI